MNIDTYDLNSVLALFSMICASAIGIYTTGKKILAMLEAYRSKRNTIENREKFVNGKLEELDAKIVENKQDIDNLKNNVDKLDQELTGILNNVTKTSKVTAKNALLQYSKELIAKQWMTQSECDTLNDLYEAYLSTSNGAPVPNVIQRALNLTVLTQEEIEDRTLNKRPFLTGHIKDDVSNFKDQFRK